MDYRIEFVLADSDTALGLLQRMAGRSDRISAQGQLFRIGDTARLTPDQDGPGVTVTGADEPALYVFLSQYFAEADPAEGGALVSRLGPPVPMMVAITNEDDAEMGETPLGFNVSAREILASEAVFNSAWPSLIHSNRAADEEDGYEEKVTATANPAEGMIYASLLKRAEPAAETISFLIYGRSPRSVMQDLVKAPNYVELDPEFLRHDLDNDAGSIEAVSFGTSEGPAVELRVPGSLADAPEAIRIMSRNMGPDARGKIFYVMDINDAEEVFTIQPIEPDGELGEPRQIKLT